jgi:hypothetical protein
METTFITMKDTELARFEVIQQLISTQINGTEAAKLLNRSLRQVKRLKSKVVTAGAQGMIHGNRGQESNRKIKSVTIDTVTTILREKYSDFGPTLASEKLLAHHGFTLSIESVRQLMIKEKLWQPKVRRNNGEYHAWRPRKECFGEMEQFDGSYHHWFEDRGEECCLLAAIDDATGKITKATFGPNEGVNAVFTFWKEYSETQGKPISVYLDRYSTYKVNHKSATDNHDLLTQFQRAAQELDIRLISAYSPQAKGRVERLFGTLQDRLVKELRLAGISDIETANTFLSDVFISQFNAKFAVVPAKATDLHRTLSPAESLQLPTIFSVQSERQVNNDFTVRFKNNWYQLLEAQPCTVLRRDRVTIDEWLDGSVHIRLRQKELSYTVTAKRPEKQQTKVTALVPRPTTKPAANHPWRKSQYGSETKKIKVFATTY